VRSEMGSNRHASRIFRSPGRKTGDRACLRRRAAILLETILALLLIALAIGALGGLLASSIRGVRQAELRTRALLLAESKFAELQLGLIDPSEENSGDFLGHPPRFTWYIETEPTEVQGLELVTVTITYDDPSDYFVHRLRRLHSKPLNLSLDQMKGIAEDPTQLTALGASDLAEAIPMLSEMPGYEQLIQAVMAGGISQVLRIYDGVMSGQIGPDQLANLAQELLGGQVSGLGGGTASSATPQLAQASGPIPWTDEETAVLVEEPQMQEIQLASAEGEDAGLEELQPEEGVASARPGRAGERASGRPGAEVQMPEEIRELADEPMSRDEAIRRMTEILQRMAAERGQ